MRLLPGFVVLWLLVAVADVRAHVACTSPDDLCAGDPCVIRTLAVQTRASSILDTARSRSRVPSRCPMTEPS